MAHAAFFRDVAAYLSAVYNGVFPGKSADLVDFARKMRAMRVTPCTEELVGEIITMENLSLAPDKTDRQLLPDWRYNPSLVTPVLDAARRCASAVTRIECIQLVSELLDTAAKIEQDAVAQAYQADKVKLVDAILALPSYREIMTPLYDAIRNFAANNTGQCVVSIFSNGFVKDRQGVEGCTAVMMAEFLRTGELVTDLGESVRGPFIISFLDTGHVIYTTNPYLALVYLICEGVIQTIAGGSTTDDLQEQLDFARCLADELSVSTPIPAEVNAYTWIRRAETLLHARQRKMPLRSILDLPGPSRIDASNQIYSLVAADLMREKFLAARASSILHVRRDNYAEAKMLLSSLLSADQTEGRLMVAQIDAQFPTLSVSRSAVQIPPDAVRETLEKYNRV